MYLRQKEGYLANVKELTEQWAHTEKVYERHVNAITVCIFAPILYRANFLLIQEQLEKHTMKSFEFMERESILKKELGEAKSLVLISIKSHCSC